MSKYYISKCCGNQVDILCFESWGEKKTIYKCKSCGRPCEVTTMIDTPGGVPEDVKQYQEDIKAGVDVSGKTEHKCGGELCIVCGYNKKINKTEQIRCEHNVVKKYCFNCKFTDKYGLKIEMFNNHHYVRLKAVDKLFSEQRQEVIDDYQTNYEQQHLASAIKVVRQSILEEVENMSLDKVLEELDEKFAYDWSENIGGYNILLDKEGGKPMSKEQLLDFIRQTHILGKQEGLQEAVEKLLKEADSDIMEWNYREGYNKALDTVISIIKRK